MKDSSIWLIVAACVVAAIAIIGAVLLTFSAVSHEDPITRAQASRTSNESADVSLEIEQRIQVVLYFQSPGNIYRLVPVEREIYNMISLSQQASQVLQQLIEGPQPGEPGFSTVPRSTKLLRFYVSQSGIGYAVFNERLSTEHPGGTTSELMTVYSIVNTICVNFPSIQAVQIVIDKHVDTTLAGHIDISRPLRLDEDYFAFTPRPETPREEDERETGEGESRQEVVPEGDGRRE
jgi:spore germination protein GerM